ncbi:MAG: hypothetical protein KAG18_06490, partial [Sinobacterium sp.]|nr:hypothetical protein [Sinobacterium sp.]
KDASNNDLDCSEIITLFAQWLKVFIKLPIVIIKQFFNGNKRLPKELFVMLTGLVEVFDQFREEGFTAFLKSTLFDMLDVGNGREYLNAKTLKDYEKMYADAPLPSVLEIPMQPWMNHTDPKDTWDQDWYLGYTQIAGFNTTNLKAVRLAENSTQKSILLDELLSKMPINDHLFQAVTACELSLEEAASQGLLFACDYAMLNGISGGKLNGQQRYPVAPIAVFFWNANPPAGYPTDGALQPIAIQINQQHDDISNPIFTPHDESNSNDANGVKWRLAKSAVQNACAVQHETVAHLGACHLVIDPMVIAANRQLHEDHPLLVLLKPHFRYTLQINNGAIHSLIVPGGVVSSVVSSSIEGSAKMIIDAHAKWQFDEQIPTRLFKERGLENTHLPSFPFREDTLDIWSATHEYVNEYLTLYYGSNAETAKQAMLDDKELQHWVNEMVNTRCAATKGLNGLTQTGDDKMPVSLDNFDYFVDIIALIIYTASAQHASVNYAQYPLMTYIPSVSGTLYKPAPNKTENLTADDFIQWLPPLDVALYQLSFGLLLSSVQYDTLGYYDKKKSQYFKDNKAQAVVNKFQQQLAKVEQKIGQRNQQRPFAYPFQLPSKIPNSISI